MLEANPLNSEEVQEKVGGASREEESERNNAGGLKDVWAWEFWMQGETRRSQKTITACCC